MTGKENETTIYRFIYIHLNQGSHFTKKKVSHRHIDHKDEKFMYSNFINIHLNHRQKIYVQHCQELDSLRALKPN